MSARIRKSRLAFSDIVDCATYLGERSSPSAERFLVALEQVLDSLADHPELGTRFASADPRLNNLRIWRVPGFKSHLVFYRPTRQGIEVVRILHAARDWQDLLEDG